VNAAPRLSIGLPVYNGENYLAESIDALLGQSYEDFELIISDNASTDGTADICRRYGKQDSRIRYVRQQRNIGLVPNHNFVFRQSRGELFKWASADDLYARDLLQRCVAALDEHPDVVLAHSWEAAIDAAGNVTQSLGYPLATDSPRAPERFRSILFGSSGLFERSILFGSSGRSDNNEADAHGLVRVDNRGILRACDEYGVIGPTSCAGWLRSAVTTTRTG
jgi:glycosyltransferase involved in cell wall biosynthesis